MAKADASEADAAETSAPEADAPDGERASILDAVLMAGALVLLLVMFYEMYGVRRTDDLFTPLLAAVAGTALLWPLRRQRAARALLIAGGLLLLFWLGDVLGPVLLPFAGIYMLAFLLNPPVTYLQQRFDLPRWASAAVVTVLAVGAVALFAVLIVPDLVAEVQVLAGRLLSTADELSDTLASSPLVTRLEEAGLIDADRLAAQLTAAVQQQATYLSNNLPMAVQRAFSSLGSLLGFLLIVGVLPAVLYYTVKDYPRLAQRLTGLLPTFGGQRGYLVEVSSVVGNYVRGMLIISVIASFDVSVVLLLLGVPFAILIGLAGGVMNMIPNIGALITAVGGVLVAAAFGTPQDALLVLLVLVGQNLLEQSVLSPKILSHQVGLHPVLVLLSLFVFGYFFGFFGLLIAVPVTALGVTAYRTRSRRLTLEVGSSEATEEKRAQPEENSRPAPDVPARPQKQVQN